MNARCVWRLMGRIAAVLSVVIGFVYVIYFWNLDQKLMARLHGLAHRLCCCRDTENIG